MAKLTKGTLKELLRECLVELMEEEGISFIKEGAPASATPRPTAPESAARVPASPAPARPIENQMLKESIKELTGNMPDMFASIFEDTARTTLQEQLANEGKVVLPPSEEAMAADETVLKEMAEGGDLGRWASVAFAGQSKK